MRYIVIIGGTIQRDGAHEDSAFLCHQWFEAPEMPDRAVLTAQVEAIIVEWEISDINSVAPPVFWPEHWDNPTLNGDGLSLEVQISQPPE